MSSVTLEGLEAWRVIEWQKILVSEYGMTDEWVVQHSARALKRAREMGIDGDYQGDVPWFLIYSPYRENPDYLESEHWKNYRRMRIAHAHDRCERCMISRKNCRARYGVDLDVHHLNYDHLRNEELSDTLVVCRRCHLFYECERVGHLQFVETSRSPRHIRCVCGEYVGKV